MTMTKEEIFQERERNASKVWDTVYSEVFPTMPPSYPNAWTRSSMLRFSDQENDSLRQECEELKRINSEYKQILKPILDWGQTEGLEHGLKLGESITTTVLNRAKEYNQLRAEKERMKKHLNAAIESKQFFENKASEFGSLIGEKQETIESLRKRCEDLEAILDNNGLSWTYKKLSQ